MGAVFRCAGLVFVLSVEVGGIFFVFFQITII